MFHCCQLSCHVIQQMSWIWHPISLKFLILWPTFLQSPCPLPALANYCLTLCFCEVYVYLSFGVWLIVRHLSPLISPVVLQMKAFPSFLCTMVSCCIYLPDSLHLFICWWILLLIPYCTAMSWRVCTFLSDSVLFRCGPSSGITGSNAYTFSRSKW